MTSITEKEFNQILKIFHITDLSFIDRFLIDGEEIIQRFSGEDSFAVFTNKRILFLELDEHFTEESSHIFRSLSYHNITGFGVVCPQDPNRHIKLNLSLPNAKSHLFAFKDADTAIKISKLIAEKN